MLHHILDGILGAAPLKNGPVSLGFGVEAVCHIEFMDEEYQ
jgi:hypothetical protein